jgi:FlaA1/EpsC-like NDP-sugar epimerase
MVYGDSMDAARIVGYFKGKSILITGSTGFLGKSMHLVYSILHNIINDICFN